MKIYVNLAMGDKEKNFPSAITKDGRSYNEQVFRYFQCPISTIYVALFTVVNLMKCIFASYLLLLLMSLGESVKMQGSYVSLLTLVKKPRLQHWKQWMLKLPLVRYLTNSLTQFK